MNLFPIDDYLVSIKLSFHAHPIGFLHSILNYSWFLAYNVYKNLGENNVYKNLKLTIFITLLQ